MIRRLGEGTWTDHWKPSRRPLLVVPIGSCEQHGPHLPLDTDTRIAQALAASLIKNFDSGELLLTPPLGISASAEHASFPGTLSIGAAVFEQVVIELVRSADWAAGIVLVNGHGGNRVPVERAVRLLQNEQRRVLSWWPHIPDGDAHAGQAETSMMLAISPELVRMQAAEPGRMEPVEELIEEMRAHGVGAVSPNGVLGDPRRATASHGRSLLTRLSIDLLAAVDEWWE
ncbi:MAG: mycofactocin biosynthesis peptidyl-dipeptidase MftE [Actinobacteria bacterium]|nr:mycofactocin biosynthesis peptidyl-dipeptidase MftE [Actinomycetota bacterium]